MLIGVGNRYPGQEMEDRVNHLCRLLYRPRVFKVAAVQLYSISGCNWQSFEMAGVIARIIAHECAHLFARLHQASTGSKPINPPAPVTNAFCNSLDLVG